MDKHNWIIFIGGAINFTIGYIMGKNSNKNK